jgi:hypothetical protein
VVKNCSLDRASIDLEYRGLCFAVNGFTVDAIDNHQSLLGNVRHQAYGAQKTRGVIDQVKKSRQTNKTEQTRDEHDQLMDGSFGLIQASDGEEEREYEQAHGVTDDVVPQ